MAKKNKTTATTASVAEHLEAIADEEQRRDCQKLAQLFRRWTGHPPKMWGPTIVGFGSYHYQYESGHEGDMCLTGFAARKNQLVAYVLAPGANQDELLGRLGKHKRGKSCLYFRRLSDIDLAVLEQLVLEAVQEVKRRYG